MHVFFFSFQKMKGDTRYGESILAGKEPSACVLALHLCLFRTLNVKLCWMQDKLWLCSMKDRTSFDFPRLSPSGVADLR